MADTDAKTTTAAPAASASKPAVPTKPAPVAASKPAEPAKPVAAPKPAAPAATTRSVSSPAPAPAAAKPIPTVAAKPAPVATKPVPKPAKAAVPKIKSAPAAPAPKPKAIEAAATKRVAKAVTPPKPKPVAIVAAAQTARPAAERAITEGSKTMNETVMKAQETAKKFTTDATARTQAVFGEFTERAKAGYEKSVKMAEEMNEFSKGNIEALVESSKLAAKGVETLGQEAADYARKSFESSSAALKTFASAKSPTEFFKLQSDYMKSAFDTAVAESSKVTEAWLKLAGDVAQPLSNRYAVAVEKIKLANA